MTDGKDMKLTVCVVTYNQRDYIRECLDSILSQETNFDFDVLIGDDCSTDGTTAIVKEFQSLYGDRVHVLAHEANVGAVANYRAVHRAATGMYVAHIDGDDCMLPGKLQKQVDALDADLSLAAVFHQLAMIDMDGKSLGRNWPESAPSKFDTAFLLSNHPVVGHSAMMYRKGLLDGLLAATYGFIDFRVYFELSLAGLIGYLDEQLGKYRAGVGISSKSSFLEQIMSVIDVADVLCADKEMVRRGRAAQLFRASLNDFYRGNYSGFRELIELSRAAATLGRVQNFFHANRERPQLLRVGARLYKVLREIGFMKDLKMSLKR